MTVHLVVFNFSPQHALEGIHHLKTSFSKSFHFSPGFVGCLLWRVLLPPRCKFPEKAEKLWRPHSEVRLTLFLDSTVKKKIRHTDRKSIEHHQELKSLHVPFLVVDSVGRLQRQSLVVVRFSHYSKVVFPLPMFPCPFAHAHRHLEWQIYVSYFYSPFCYYSSCPSPNGIKPRLSFEFFPPGLSRCL